MKKKSVIKEENKQKVLNFFMKNPFKTQTDCVKETGLSIITVQRHHQQIKREWKEK